MRWFLCLLLVASCHPHNTVPVNPAGGIGGDPVTPDELDDDARVDLDAAAQLLADGKPGEARTAYDRAGTTHPAAEPYARVMALVAAGRVNPDSSSDELEAIAADPDTPVDARRAAAAYFAIQLAQDKRPTDAGAAMVRLYPGTRPSWLVLEADRASSMGLLAEGAFASGDIGRAATALSWTFQLGDPDERLYARSRCATMLSRATPDALQALADSEDDFLRALSGAALVRSALDAGGADRLAAARERLTAAAPALVRINAGEEAELLNARMAHAEGPRPLRIGVLLPLTGRARGVGARALGGVLLAQGGLGTAAASQSTIVLEDTRSSADGAAAGVDALHARGVVAIVGPLDDREAAAAATRAQALGVPLLTLTLDTQVVSTGNMVFRNFVDSRAEVVELVSRARRLGARRIGVAHPKGPLGNDLAEATARAAEKEGIEVVTSISYDPGANNFANVAAKLRRKRVDAIFIPDVASRVSQILPFLAAEQLWCKPPGTTFPDDDERRAIVCLGNVLWHDASLLRDGGTYADGAQIVAAWSPLSDTAANRQFVAAHRGTLGSEADVFSAFAYDSVRLIRHLALAERRRSASEAREGLGGLASFPGLTGPMRADASGEIHQERVWVTVSKGQFAPLHEP